MKIFILVLIFSLWAHAKSESENEKFNFEASRVELSSAMEKFAQILKSLPPEKRKTLQKKASDEIKIQNHYIDNDLGLNPSELKATHELYRKEWMSLGQAKKPADRATARDDLNDAIWKIFGQKRYKKFHEYRMKRINEMLGSLDKKNTAP